MEDTEQTVESAPRMRALAIGSEENSWKRHALYGGAPHKREGSYCASNPGKTFDAGGVHPMYEGDSVGAALGAGPDEVGEVPRSRHSACLGRSGWLAHSAQSGTGISADRAGVAHR